MSDRLVIQMWIEALLVRIEGLSYNNTDTFVVIMYWANNKHPCSPPQNPIEHATEKSIMQWEYKCSVQLERVPRGYGITLYYCAQNMYTYMCLAWL